MKSAFAFLCQCAAVASLVLPHTVMAATCLLTQTVLEIGHEAAKLSALAYANATEYAQYDYENQTVGVGYKHPDYEYINFYNSEPGQAILAKAGDGRCYVAFRGTTLSLEDWYQNLNPDKALVHENNDETEPYCVVREGYAEFVLELMESTSAPSDWANCVQSCQHGANECLVLTGHSQGAAEAGILSIIANDLNPIVVTFGMPLAIGGDCDLVPRRFYRYVNTVEEDEKGQGINYDPVPFLPSFAVHYGYYIMLGPDATAAKYLGYNTAYSFEPAFTPGMSEILDALDAHAMSSAGGRNYSYEARIAALLNSSSSFNISTDGFSNGTACNLEDEELCASGMCQDFTCGSCSSTRL